jgi:hypothetical protein
MIRVTVHTGASTGISDMFICRIITSDTLSNQ